MQTRKENFIIDIQTEKTEQLVKKMEQHGRRRINHY